MILTSSGPANISGNKVSTSIFMLHFQGGKRSARRPVLNNFQGASQTLARAAGREQGANRVDRHALPANHPPHILRIEAQLVNRQPIALDWSYRYLARMFDESLNDIFQERLHGWLGRGHRHPGGF